MVFNNYFLSTICHEEFSIPNTKRAASVDALQQLASPPTLAVQQTPGTNEGTSLDASCLPGPATSKQASGSLQKSIFGSATSIPSYMSAAANYRLQMPSFTVRYLSNNNSGGVKQSIYSSPELAVSQQMPQSLAANLRRNSEIMHRCTSPPR